MVWKPEMEAQKTWRRLMAYQQITLVMEGRRFVDRDPKEVACGFNDGCAFFLQPFTFEQYPPLNAQL